MAEKQSGDLLINTIKANVEQSRDQIMQNKELKPAMDSGKLKVVTGYYSLDDGTVSLA